MGARCFAPLFSDKRLTGQESEIQGEPLGAYHLSPHVNPDGLGTSDMGAPRFDLSSDSFEADIRAWPLPL